MSSSCRLFIRAELGDEQPRLVWSNTGPHRTHAPRRLPENRAVAQRGADIIVFDRHGATLGEAGAVRKRALAVGAQQTAKWLLVTALQEALRRRPAWRPRDAPDRRNASRGASAIRPREFVLGLGLPAAGGAFLRIHSASRAMASWARARINVRGACSWQGHAPGRFRDRARRTTRRDRDDQIHAIVAAGIGQLRAALDQHIHEQVERTLIAAALPDEQFEPAFDRVILL